MFEIINCPWCGIYIQILHSEINCKIFRCGIEKSSGKQIDPHASKEVCDHLLANNLIYGCSKPFIFDGNITKKCDYI